MIVQNKAGFTGGSRITFLSSWHRIKISVANEARIILEVVDYEGNCIAYLGVYPKKYEGLVMANIEEQIKKQILAGVKTEDLFIVAPYESELEERGDIDVEIDNAKNEDGAQKK